MKEQAKKRMEAEFNQHSPTPVPAEASKGEVRETLAKQAGVGKTTYGQLSKVLEIYFLVGLFYDSLIARRLDKRLDKTFEKQKAPTGNPISA